MLRSMYSGISGLKNFQTKLDVIGNNISNVNTYGFKKGRTVFKDMISQTTSGASAATATRGGVNPKQVGLGSQVASIDTIHTGGSLQSTGRVLDLAISGDGFFQLADGAGGSATTDPTGYATGRLFSRAGNFYMDSRGFIVNGDGKYLVGTTPSAADPTIPSNPAKPIKIPTDAQSMSIGQDGSVTFVDVGGNLRTAGQIMLVKFPNSGGLTKTGANYFEKSPASGDPTPLAGAAPLTDGLGGVQSGFLEMSNVDLSEEFTEMIVAQRGFQANTRIITTSDEILQELVNLKR
ncbi:flagellar basal body rod protein FlgG [Paenisporosarcina quisquiliarum]|uniref:flagellar basal body rod protein FlgG n=1 Tax=Paenisporosarcina quisquiliarum TaxID=365346 RepID=UPI003734D852